MRERTMTEHPDEGLLQALLDDEVEEGRRGALRRHLEGCEACRRELESLRYRSETLSEALSLLDRDPPMEDAWATVRTRRRSPSFPNRGEVGVLGMDRKRERGRRRGSGIPTGARVAAAVVLLLGGAAAALPGSPVREWVEESWVRWRGEAASGEGAEGVSPGEGRQAPGGERDEVGAGVALVDGRVEVTVQDLPSEAQVNVLLVEGTRAAIFGPQGTRFRTEAGRIQAVGPRGDVRIELPRSAARARLVVNGQTYLTMTDGRVEITGPVERRGEAGIWFRDFPPEG